MFLESVFMTSSLLCGCFDGFLGVCFMLSVCSTKFICALTTYGGPSVDVATGCFLRLSFPFSQNWHCRLHKGTQLSGKASVGTAGSQRLVVSTHIFSLPFAHRCTKKCIHAHRPNTICLSAHNILAISKQTQLCQWTARQTWHVC